MQAAQIQVPPKDKFGSAYVLFLILIVGQHLKVRRFHINVQISSFS